MAAKLLAYSLFLLLSVGTLRADQAEKTWCVAKPSTSESELLNILKWVCGEVDCRILQNGGACNLPDTLINHASIAMNIYYQCHGRHTWECHFGDSGLITITNPSYGGCQYA